ncbi:serine/threonine-protein kinase [Streptomyces formicae]|uniref:non-specific serine/threonine protein kinase n=1 Tax=Streptomyces formicae TaxID=1616117 RepID=A0ABY3WXN8_9ACTN|nr:serine/threonine-protein kinase [Streptomyces formicae]UNM14543.1 serine/threonine protein kinase [Streptomyces formicae]
MHAPGELIDGRFELLERLGSGGMGTVWRARDTVLHREVALKAVRSDADTSDAVRERVLREARALARLSHPHVVTVHHIVDTQPHPWIVMELVPGSSLQDRLTARGPLPAPEAARIGRQVLSALGAAHAVGIQHRDVKPANVLLRPDGSAVLTDFGIAALQGSVSLTVPGELIGSPEYIAPERLRGHGDTAAFPFGASDLWSLGLLLYVSTEGVSPLRRETTFATLAAVLDDPVPPPARSGPLTPVIQALLVRDPAARPDAARLDAMLAQAESGTAPYWAQPTMTTAVPPEPLPPVPTQRDSPRPTAPQPAGAPERQRNRTAVVVAVIAVAVAVTAAVALAVSLSDQGKNTAGGSGGVPGGGVGSTAPATPTATPTPSPTPTPTPSPTPTVTVTASVTASVSPPPPSGRWIAQLFSEPVGSGAATRDQRLAKVRETVPEAEYLRSDTYASLRPGYWVIYAPGPFDDGRAALAFCADRGMTAANDCFGRYLSADPDDFALQCRPPASSPSGRCTRS